MQIHFNLDIPKLKRDPTQSLSTFYREVKKLVHFQDQNFDQYRNMTDTLDNFLKKNRHNFLQTRVNANSF